MKHETIEKNVGLLLLLMICVKSWHFPHNAYGPAMLKSGLGNRLLIACPGTGAWLNSYRRSRMW